MAFVRTLESGSDEVGKIGRAAKKWVVESYSCHNRKWIHFHLENICKYRYVEEEKNEKWEKGPIFHPHR